MLKDIGISRSEAEHEWRQAVLARLGRGADALPVLTCDVFTERRFGGNQLAVLPDAKGLDRGQMQAIAAEFNYSETTFVLPPADPGPPGRVRIFTPELRCRLPATHGRHGAGAGMAAIAGRPAARSCWRNRPGRCRSVQTGRDCSLVAEFSAPKRRRTGGIGGRPGRGGLGLSRRCYGDGGRAAMRGVLRRAFPAGRARQPRSPGAGCSRDGAILLADRPGVYLFRARGGRPGRPCTDVRARSMECLRTRRPGVRPRPWPAIWPDGRVWPTAGTVGASAQDGDGAAEPDRGAGPAGAKER